MTRVGIIVGTRPEIIKMASVIKNCQKTLGLEAVLVHTGQHYDWEMSEVFLKELDLPNPAAYLNVRSGIEQFAKIVLRTTKFLAKTRPDVVLVEGDTNSAVGVALACSKLGIPVGHVEAGCRSFDRLMEEEINRLVIASCADAHFAPTETSKRNLLNEGINPETIYLTGHPIVETVSRMLPRIRFSTITDDLGLKTQRYILLTLHRAENVDNPESLCDVIEALRVIREPIVFPIHPRTKLRLRQFGLLKTVQSSGILVVPPCSYVSALRLIADSAMVLTDSGGIQQEGALLNTPCVTLRKTTEWVETLKAGINFLAPPRSGHLQSVIRKVYGNLPCIRRRFVHIGKLFGDTLASKRIIRIVKSKKVGRR